MSDKLNRTTVGAAVVAVSLLVMVVVFGGFLERATERSGREVTATFRTSARLAIGDPVRVRGVEAGRVRRFRYDEQRRVAVVTMHVYENVPELYSDARADIGWRTVLGGTYAINLDPGTAAAGPLPGEAIALRRTGSQVEVDEILTVMQPEPRAGLRTLLDEVPDALADPDGVAGAAREVGRSAPKLARGLRALRGEQSDDLRQLIRHSTRTVKALNTTQRTVRDVVEGGAATLAVTGQRAHELERTLDRLGADQPEIRTTLTRLRSTLDRADPLIAALDRAAPDISPTVAQLRPLLVDADDVLRLSRPLLQTLRPATAALAQTASDSVPVLDALPPILERVNRQILPDLAKPDPVTRRPTYAMIGPTLSAVTTSGAMFDNVSHILTLAAGGGERALDTLPCSTFLTDPTAKQLVVCNDLGSYLGRLFGSTDGSTR